MWKPIRINMQTKKIISNIINSSNKMKGQTKRCHTFSVFLFIQLSLYKQCSRKYFDFGQITQQFLEASAFFLTWSHTAPNLRKVALVKLILSRESQPPDLQKGSKKCEIYPASFTWLAIVKQDWQAVLNYKKRLFPHFSS